MVTLSLGLLVTTVAGFWSYWIRGCTLPLEHMVTYGGQMLPALFHVWCRPWGWGSVTGRSG
jgi:hypothetical protein